MVCGHCARCFAVAARFPACRDLCRDMPQLCHDLVPLLRRPHLGETACAGAEAAAALAGEPASRARLARAGALHALLPAALRYDYTLAESGVHADAGANVQQTANQLAKQCVIALAAMYGPHELPSPDDDQIRAALDCLLTPYICGRLAEPDQHELLKMLTSNWRSPYLVWDNSTRAELKEILRNTRLPLEDDAPLVEPFTYSAHEGLLTVGGVYIDIYNEQPEFVIENPQQLILDLLKFLQEQTKEELTHDRAEHITIALTALANVIIKNPGVEIQCIGQFGLIFGLMSARPHPGVQMAAVKAVGAAAGSRECVEDVAATNVMGHLLALLTQRPPKQEVFVALAALFANTAIVKEALAKGGVIYLLDLFCNSKMPETREAAVELLARMMADKLHGPKVRLTISRYIPGVFAEAMREAGSSAALHLFDAPHEHPELVWTDECRNTLAAHVAQLRDRHQSGQLRDANIAFEDRETLERAAAGEQVWAPAGELVVGGVYLKLYIQNPHWNLRSPKRFLQDLLTETMAQLPKDCAEGGKGDICARALTALLRARPALGEAAAQLGEVPRIARLLPSYPLHVVPVLAAIANQPACVVALSQTDVMGGLKTAVSSCREIVGSACEALSSIFTSSANTDRLVHQALETDLIGTLLGLLESRLDGPAAARLVGALKAMARCAPHAERVRAALAKSRVWDQYAAQRHDLFISSAPQHHTLTGAPHSAGYLTAPPSSIPAQPPPID